MDDKHTRDRLEYLRGEIEAERIGYEEIAELQSLARHIEPDDVLLLEWAGVPESTNDKHTPTPYYVMADDEHLPRWAYFIRHELEGEHESIDICVMISDEMSKEEAKANAEFIVKACNNWDEIVGLLPDILLYVTINEDDPEDDEAQLATYENGNHILNVTERLQEIIGWNGPKCLNMSIEQRESA